MGWLKRLSPRKYDQQSRHAVLIGQKSGNIVDLTLCNIICRTCNNVYGKSLSPKPHDCNKNWIVSSKSMECDGIVKLCMIPASKKI